MRVEWVASSLTLYLRTWCIQHYYHYYRWCALLDCQQSTELTPHPANLNGLGRFAERPNLVSARVSSRFKRALQLYYFFNFDARWGWVVEATLLLPYPRERAPVPTVTPTEGTGSTLKWSLMQYHFIPQNTVLINLGPNPGDQEAKRFLYMLWI